MKTRVFINKGAGGPSAVVFAINWSQPVTDFFVPSPFPLLHLTRKKKKIINKGAKRIYCTTQANIAVVL